jgi:hypothetical protein
MADLADASRTFAGLAERCPGLPAAFFTVSFIYPRQVDVQLRALEHVEPWREALGVRPAMIEAANVGGTLHLEFSVPVDGIEVRVYVMSPVAEGVAPLASEAPVEAAAEVAA